MATNPLYWIATNVVSENFPTTDEALKEPDGLLAAGGDLTADTLLDAYRRGIFPWYSEGQPILWWSPDPRSVLQLDALHISRSLKRRIQSGIYRVTIDQSFEDVVECCSAPRKSQSGTWITADMQAAYCQLHRLGHAHSVECWHQQKLVGGLYGVGIGKVFFGESMFAAMADASKVCLVHLVDNLRAWGYALIDCQVHNPHLESLGARPIARRHFIAQLNDLCGLQPAAHAWQTEVGV